MDERAKEPTQNIVVCIKHWPFNYQTFIKKGHKIPADSPFIFSVPCSFAHKLEVHHEK